MATEQFGPNTYTVGGQPTLGGALAGKYEVLEATYGMQEDLEEQKEPNGTFGSDTVYSRRETCSLTLRALGDGTDPTNANVDALVLASQLASGILAMKDGTATAWNVEDASSPQTRGPREITMELIQQGDKLTA